MKELEIDEEEVSKFRKSQGKSNRNVLDLEKLH